MLRLSGALGLISGNTHDRDAFPIATIQSPMQRCNAVLRAFGARYRLREHRPSPWITVYQLGKGGTTREHTVKGYAAADPEAIASLHDLLPDGQEGLVSADCAAPYWPEICAAVVALQRGQGVNINLVGPFKGKGYFRLLPADRAATGPDDRRFALHSRESLKARLDQAGARSVRTRGQPCRCSAHHALSGSG